MIKEFTQEQKQRLVDLLNTKKIYENESEELITFYLEVTDEMIEENDGPLSDGFSLYCKEYEGEYSDMYCELKEKAPYEETMSMEDFMVEYVEKLYTEEDLERFLKEVSEKIEDR